MLTEPSFTIGIEEEYLLVDPRTRDLIREAPPEMMPRCVSELEDQVTPKRCGHFAGKQLIGSEEMAFKLRAAIDARRDPGFVIVANRTDRDRVGEDVAA